MICNNRRCSRVCDTVCKAPDPLTIESKATSTRTSIFKSIQESIHLTYHTYANVYHNFKNATITREADPFRTRAEEIPLFCHNVCTSSLTRLAYQYKYLGAHAKIQIAL